MRQRFTERTRAAIRLAQEEAIKMQCREIQPHHLLLGLLRQPESLAGHILNRQGLTYAVAQMYNNGPQPADPLDPTAGGTKAELTFTKQAKKVLELAAEAAHRPNNKYIGTEHLLLALVNFKEGTAFHLLSEYDVEPDNIYPFLYVRHCLKKA